MDDDVDDGIGKWENGKRAGVGGFVRLGLRKVYHQRWREGDVDELDKCEDRLTELGKLTPLYTSSIIAVDEI